MGFTTVPLSIRILATLICAIVAGCGVQVYRPPASTQFGLDSASEIDDEDIRKAFEARPQVRDQARIAYYSFDPDKSEDLERMLLALPGVAGTYGIPSLLTTGHRRYEEPRPWDPPAPPVSVKKLRLLAARAHCDLLVVFDYGSKIASSANGWAALDVLLIPALVVPFLDVKAESYSDAYIIDTRNGYLYAEVSARKSDSRDGVTIYSSVGSEMVHSQWPQLARDTSDAMRRVLQSERGHSQPSIPAVDR